MKKLFLIPLVIVLISGMILGGCSQPEPEQAKPLKIGCLAPITGPYAQWGKWFLQAFDLALDEANMELGGRPVEWLVEDEGGMDVGMALDKAKKLVEADKIEIMVGPFFGGSHFSVCPYTSSLPMIDMIYTDAGRSEDELKNKYTFWMTPGYSDTSWCIGEYAYDVLGYREVTTIGSDNQVGYDFLSGFTDAFQEKGGTVIQQQWYPLGETDYTPYISAMKICDACVDCSLSEADRAGFYAQYDEMGMFDKMPIILGKGGAISVELMPEWGDKIIGIIGSQEYLPNEDNPANKAFVEAYTSRYDDIPDEKANNAYCTIKVLEAALEVTGGNTDADVLKQTLLDLEYDLTNGKFYFDEGRIAVEPIHVTEVQKIDGVYQWVILKTYPENKTRMQTFP